MIPAIEVDAYVQTVDDAFSSAERGGTVRCYMLLKEGLRRAEQADEYGEPWAGELQDIWREALAEFFARYPVHAGA